MLADSLATPTVPGLDALRHVSVEEILLLVLTQLVVIILAARAFAVLFRRLGQPSVVGEILAGLLLGPSVLGYLWPAGFNAVFHPTVPGVDPALFDQVMQRIFGAVSQVGLIFLLFLIGLEFDFKHLRWHGKAALGISLAGIAFPFLLGLGVARLLIAHPSVDAWLASPHPTLTREVRELAFSLFLGTALSITAIPILGRMMMELNITRTRLGAVTISAAAVDDAVGWILLASVAAVARTQFRLSASLLMLAETVGFALFMAYAARPALRWWIRRTLGKNQGDLDVNALAVLLVVLFLCAIATNLIGIFAIFGAFFLGAVLSEEEAFRQAVTRKLHAFVTAFFLPIFFTYTGLRTNVGTLGTAELWGLCALLCAAAVLGKFGGCGLAARWGGFSPREACCIGVMMNTRALMELIVINLGYELGVIPASVFCMLVLMAILTTVVTSPLLLRWMPGTELEPYIRQSGFVQTPRRLRAPEENRPLSGAV